MLFEIMQQQKKLVFKQGICAAFINTLEGNCGTAKSTWNKGGCLFSHGGCGLCDRSDSGNGRVRWNKGALTKKLSFCRCEGSMDSREDDDGLRGWLGRRVRRGLWGSWWGSRRR